MQSSHWQLYLPLCDLNKTKAVFFGKKIPSSITELINQNGTVAWPRSRGQHRVRHYSLLKFAILSAEIRNLNRGFSNSQAATLCRENSCRSKTKDAFGWQLHVSGPRLPLTRGQSDERVNSSSSKRTRGWRCAAIGRRPRCSRHQRCCAASGRRQQHRACGRQWN